MGSDAGSLEPGFMPDEPRVFLSSRARAAVENNFRDIVPMT